MSQHQIEKKRVDECFCPLSLSTLSSVIITKLLNDNNSTDRINFVPQHCLLLLIFGLPLRQPVIFRTQKRKVRHQVFVLAFWPSRTLTFFAPIITNGTPLPGRLLAPTYSTLLLDDDSAPGLVRLN
jgi:hypothetical protein